MRISCEQYAQAARILGIELPPWMGEDPKLEHASSVILAVNDVDCEIAMKLWYHLISNSLSFDQMTRLATYMVHGGWHVLSCRMNNLADLEDVPAAELEKCMMARDMVCGAQNLLRHWRDDPEFRYSGHYLEADDYHINVIRALFLLPWNMPPLDEVGEFWYLLSDACGWLGRLGIGAVGYDDKFTIAVNFLGGDTLCTRTQLNLEFQSGAERLPSPLLGFIPCPDVGVVGFWAQCGDLEPQLVSFRKQDLKSIAAHLGLSPAMSRNEIEAAFNTLALSHDRPNPIS